MTKTIAIDFDGVIHAYTSGWRGSVVIPDPPVPGALEFVERLVAHEELEPVIFSSRAKTVPGTVAIAKWLLENGFPDLRIECEKPPAVVYIDDRGWTFRGVWPELRELLDFEPWKVDPA